MTNLVSQVEHRHLRFLHIPGTRDHALDIQIMTIDLYPKRIQSLKLSNYIITHDCLYNHQQKFNKDDQEDSYLTFKLVKKEIDVKSEYDRQVQPNQMQKLSAEE